MLCFFKKFFATIVMCLVPGQSFAGSVIIKDLKRSQSAWFYNKPGSTVESVARDEYSCTAFGHHMMTMTPYEDGDPYVGRAGVGGSIIGKAISSGPIRGNMDDCMMSLGYKRFTTEDATLQDFLSRYGKLSESEKNRYHSDIVPPEGTLTRQWVNTLWLYTNNEGTPSAENRTYMPTRFERSKSEKLKATRPTLKDFPSIIPQDLYKELKKPPVEFDDGDTSIIAVKIKTVSEKPAIVMFTRVDPETGEPDPSIDKKGKTKTPSILISHKNKSIEGFTIYEAPSGHYALSFYGRSFSKTHALCMKTVIFEAKAGEVIYLGEYEGVENKETVHPIAPTPRMRFRFDQGDVSELGDVLSLNKAAINADFKNNFEMQCPALYGGEKMYGVSFPGREDF